MPAGLEPTPLWAGQAGAPIKGTLDSPPTVVGAGGVFAALADGRLHLFDAASGRETAVPVQPADMRVVAVTADEAGGQPVVAVQYTHTTPASGLDPAKDIVGLQVFDASGKQLWKSEHDADLSGDDIEEWKYGRIEADRFVGGWIDRRLKADGDVTATGNDQRQIVDLQGHVAWSHRFSDGDSTLQALDAPLQEEFLHVVGNSLALFEGFALVDRSEAVPNRTTLVMRDLTRPQRPLWTSDQVRPAGAGLPEGATPDSNAPVVVGLHDGKLALLWWTPGFNALLALHDPTTGRVLGKPLPIEIPSEDKYGLKKTLAVSGEAYDAATKTLVFQPQGGSALAVDLATGARLWRQRQSQRAFTPEAAGGGVVFGSVSPSEKLALATRTGLVLGPASDARPDLINDSGQAVLIRDRVFWVFKVKQP